MEHPGQDGCGPTGRLATLVREIVARAHDSGSLRADVTWQDIVILSQASVSAGECLGEGLARPVAPVVHRHPSRAAVQLARRAGGDRGPDDGHDPVGDAVLALPAVVRGEVGPKTHRGDHAVVCVGPDVPLVA